MDNRANISFFGYIVYRQESRREKGDDMQQRAQDWNQTWAAARRTQP